MKMLNVVICVVLLAGGGLAIAQTGKSTSAGVYTEEQARKGEKAYQANCATCHGADLRSTDPEVPGLTGNSFKGNWLGKTVGEKFQVARDTMPPEAKRSLDDQTYLDIVTFILLFNNIPPGKELLRPDMEALRQIVISQ